MTHVWYKYHDDVFACGEDNFFIAREKGTHGYEFSSYQSPSEFYDVMVKLKSQPFHELIPEWRWRRIHFDLDVPRSIDWRDFVDELLIACDDTLRLRGTNLSPENVVVLDASNTKKTSVHVILSDVVTRTPTECKKFCSEVTTRMSIAVKGPIYDLISKLDIGIYQKNRCFRMPLCTKRKEERYLLPASFKYRGDNHSHCVDMPRKDLFLLGVIGVISTEGLKLVKYDLPDLAYYEARDVSNEVEQVVTYVQSCLVESEWCFEIDKVAPGSIHLKRVRPGPCRICKRVHDSIDALISVSVTGRIAFRCWNGKDVEVLGRLNENGTSTKEVQALTMKKYININVDYASVRTSDDYISCLVERYGWIE